MPKRLIQLCFVISLVSFASCHSAKSIQTDNVKRVGESEQVQQATQLMIRTANEGHQPLGNVLIRFSSVDKNGQNPTEQSENYGSLAPAEISDYRLVSGSFRYAPMETLVEGELVRRGVTDYVGEFSIPHGNYTYKLTYGSDPFNGSTEGLYGRLTYDQTDLDSAIDKALNETIIKGIVDEYYHKHSQTIEVDGDTYNRLGVSCVHQQTHRGNSRFSQVIVYAKVVCSKPSFQADLGDDIESLKAMQPLPIRIELQEKNSSFSVVDYQFPEADSEYEASMKRIFLPFKIEEIISSKIRQTTYNHLDLKKM